jgi:Uma2 family endonuclease
MASRILIPVEEYLATGYDPDCDYVDGEIQERNFGGCDHSELQLAIGAMLFALRVQRIFAFTEQRIQVSSTRFRVPDLCVTVGHRPETQIFHEPPFLCIEILSREDRASRIDDRIDDYLRFGVKWVWVIGPPSRKGHIYTGSERVEAKDGVFYTREPEIVISLAEVYRNLQ